MCCDCVKYLKTSPIHILIKKKTSPIHTEKTKLLELCILDLVSCMDINDFSVSKVFFVYVLLSFISITCLTYT